MLGAGASCCAGCQAPEPPGLRDHPLHPAAAHWQEGPTGSLALLSYDEIRTATESFWDFLSDIAVLPLFAAIGCHLLKLACTSRAWRNILAAAYPDRPVAWRPILAAYVSGVGNFEQLFFYVKQRHLAFRFGGGGSQRDRSLSMA